MKSFVVEVEPSDQLFMLGAHDKCHLCVASVELRLIGASDGRLLVTWPFTCLRRYMSTKGRFTIEAGRRAPTGEGRFVFRTPQHDEVYKLLDSVIKSKAGQPKAGGVTVEKRDKSVASPPGRDSSTPTEGGGYDHLVAPFPLPAHPTHPNYDQATIKPVPTPTSAPTPPGKSPYSSPYGHLQDRAQSLAGVAHLGSPGPKSGRGSDGDPDRVGGSSVSLSSRTTLSELAFPFELGESGDDGYDALKRPVPVPFQRFTSPPPPGADVDPARGTGAVSVPPAIAEDAEGDVYSTIDSEHDSGGLGTSVPATGSHDDNLYNTLDHSPLPTGKPIAPVRGSVPSASSSEDNVYNTLGSNPTPPGKPVVPKRGGVPSASSDEGNLYNTLDPSHTPTGKPVVPKRGGVPSASGDEGNLYNTLDPSHTPTGKPVVPKRGGVPSASGDEGNLYNTLDPSHTPTGKPVVPKRGGVASASGDEGNLYNTLDQSSIPVGKPVVPVRGGSATSGSPVDEDFYSTLDSSTTPSGRPVVPTRGVVRPSSLDDANLYNTLDQRVIPASGSSQEGAEGDGVYNTLDHAQSPPSVRGPVPPAPSGVQQRHHGVADSGHLPLTPDEDTYDTLDHGQLPCQPLPPTRSAKPSVGLTQSAQTKSPVKLPPKPPERRQLERPQQGEDAQPGEPDSAYNTLDHASVASPPQPAAVPMRCPLEGGNGASVGRPNRLSLPDTPCLLNGIEESKASSECRGSYETIDYAAFSPLKSPRGPRLPKDKTRPLPNPKGRKASAPDILAFRSGDADQRESSPKKGARSSLVSNLKASLEAGGLDFTKPRRKPHKLPRDGSVEDASPYAEPDETCGATTKTGRSPSAPAQPVEDFYAIPDEPVRPKSVQVGKTKRWTKH